MAAGKGIRLLRAGYPLIDAPNMDKVLGTLRRVFDIELGLVRSQGCGQMKAAMRKPALLSAMEAYFGEDRKRIEHARKVVAYAESLLAAERDADPNVVIAAAVLHDIGIKNAEAKHGSSEARHQEEEGPPIARAILTDLGYPEGFIKEVCDIVGHHHHPRETETPNFRVLYDADLLVNTEKERRRRGPAGLSDAMLGAYLTDHGRELAVKTAGA